MDIIRRVKRRERSAASTHHRSQIEHQPPAAPRACRRPRPLVVPAAASLGEGTLWSPREQALYWVDILGCRLHRFDPATAARSPLDLCEEISAVAERATSPGLIVTLRRGFALVRPGDGERARATCTSPKRSCRATASTTASAMRKAASGAAPWTSSASAHRRALPLRRGRPLHAPRQRLRRHQRPHLVGRRPHAVLQRHGQRPRPRLRLRRRRRDAFEQAPGRASRAATAFPTA